MDIEEKLLTQKNEMINTVLDELKNTKHAELQMNLNHLKNIAVRAEVDYSIILKEIADNYLSDLFLNNALQSNSNIFDSLLEASNNAVKEYSTFISKYTFECSYQASEKNGKKRIMKTIEVPAILPPVELMYMIMISYGFEIGYNFYLSMGEDDEYDMEDLEYSLLSDIFDDENKSCDAYFIDEVSKRQFKVHISLKKYEELNHTVQVEDLKLVKSYGGLVPLSKNQQDVSDKQIVELLSGKGAYGNVLLAKLFYQFPDLFEELATKQISFSEAIDLMNKYEDAELGVDKKNSDDCSNVRFLA